MSALLECRQVVKNFGGLTAVNRVDLQVNAGEIYGLIGPNGAGKTTLFRLISGVYPPGAGEIRFKGQRLNGLRPNAICRRGIVSTHHFVRPFPGMTVFDNVRVGAEFGRRVGGSAGAQVREVLAFTGLAPQAELPGALRDAGFEVLFETTWEQPRRFEEWAAIVADPTRTGPLRDVMSALARLGGHASLGLREAEGELLFTHTWLLAIAQLAGG
jgi:ABC-type phosphonate transport system ATPase subunit